MGGIILGAVLAVFGGIITQVIMVKWGDKRTIESLKILLLDLIDQMSQIIENLKLAYDKTNIVGFEYLMQLNNVRAIFDRNREWLIKITDSELREEIYEYFDKIMLFGMNATSLENMKYNMPQHLGYATTRLKDEVANLMLVKESSPRIKASLKSKK